MLSRTDLALERRELIGGGEISGVELKCEENKGVRITRIRVLSDEGAQAIGKPCGLYVTVEVPAFSVNAELLDGRVSVLAREIRSMLPSDIDAGVLAVGLGNRSITPDALGPQAVSHIFTTRHIRGELAHDMGLNCDSSVCAIATGVLGETGMEAVEIIKGLVANISPSAVIVIDALASRSVSHLGCTVQICDSGISPGSGVGNARSEISSLTLGVPVIAVGVPTVVDASTLVCDFLGNDEARWDEVINRIEPDGARMMVTPWEIDLITHRAAKYIAMGINCALNPQIPPEDMLSLIVD